MLHSLPSGITFQKNWSVCWVLSASQAELMLKPQSVKGLSAGQEAAAPRSCGGGGDRGGPAQAEAGGGESPGQQASEGDCWKHKCA